jgi:3-methylcrotonyl-CoA carboxylase beta subunit
MSAAMAASSCQPAAPEDDLLVIGPGAAQVVGIGIVAGREVIVHADDASVKGGAWYPLSVKKIVRALDVAIENRPPVVHLCDSAGGFLPLQAEFFADRYYAGRIFRNQSILSKMGVPQVAVVMGHCTAGGAYVPALSDYNIIARGTGAIFLAGPPLVKAATGEEVSVEELGGADMHTSVSGTGDYFASSEMHALAAAAFTNTSHGTAKRWFVALRGSTDIKSGFLPIMASCSAIAH